MAPVCVRLFGKFCVQRNLQTLIGLDNGKVHELLCYLLLHRNHPQPREALAGILWPESSADHAKRNLRQSLWQLQTALQPYQLELGDPHLLHAAPEWIDLRSGANLWLDVMVFEQVFADVRGVPGEELDNEKARRVADAVELHTGSLLEGWYQDWCVLERERLEGMYRAMLYKLMGSCAKQGDYETGLGYGTCLLVTDRARESTHRQIMRLHYLNGDRTEALRQYDRCVASLAEEFSVKPSRQTVILYEQIRADRLGGPTLISSQDSPKLETRRGVSELADSVNRLSEIVADVQNQLHQHIRWIDRFSATNTFVGHRDRVIVDINDLPRQDNVSITAKDPVIDAQ